MTLIRTDEIVVVDRHRHDLGDIKELANSIDRLGLLHPIVVTTEFRLVAGERRLAAVRSLGWEEVEVTVADNLADAVDLLQAERDENTCRMPMRPTEEHSIYEALLEIEKAEAQQRKAEAAVQSNQSRSGKVSHSEPAPRPTPIRAKAEAARGATGVPGRSKTLDKVAEAKSIAADPVAPPVVKEAATKALAEMDATNRVDGPYQRLKEIERIEALPKPDPAITEFLEKDQSVQDANYMTAFYKAIKRSRDFLTFDAERIGQLSDAEDVVTIEHLLKSTTTFLDRMRKARSGLRVINGGQQ